MSPKLWLIAGLMSAALFIMAGCGGGQDGNGSSVADSPAPGEGSGGIGSPPHVFVGTVSVDGSPAPDGTLVNAFIEGKTGPVAQAEVSGGGYTLTVEQTSGADFDGKTVTFTVSDQETSPSVSWEIGGADEVNLSVSGGSVSGGGSGSGTGGGGATDLVSQGKDLFTGTCASCHTIEGISAGLVGPDLTHIGTEGESRKTGLSAKEYITESIRDPEAFVATGVERAIPGIMTQAITAGLSDGEVDALVAFLSAQQ